MNKHLIMARYADVIAAEGRREFKEWAESTQVVNLSNIGHAKDFYPRLSILGKMTIALKGEALALLEYEILPLVFVDDLSYGTYRWYVSQRFSHTPRETQRSFKALTGKDLRNIYNIVRSKHADACKHPEMFPGWATIRAEQIPVARKIKAIKSWLGDLEFAYSTKK